MILYAIKNDEGKWLGWEVYQDDPEFICGGGSVWTDLDKAKFYAKANGGHVVELVEESEKPKQFVLPMEGTKLADGTIAYATLDHTGVWTIKGYAVNQSAVAFHNTVTQADIDAAPDWVKAIKPVDVTYDD